MHRWGALACGVAARVVALLARLLFAGLLLSRTRPSRLAGCRCRLGRRSTGRSCRRLSVGRRPSCRSRLRLAPARGRRLRRPLRVRRGHPCRRRRPAGRRASWPPPDCSPLRPPCESLSFLSGEPTGASLSSRPGRLSSWFFFVPWRIGVVAAGRILAPRRCCARRRVAVALVHRAVGRRLLSLLLSFVRRRPVSLRGLGWRLRACSGSRQPRRLVAACRRLVRRDLGVGAPSACGCWPEPCWPCPAAFFDWGEPFGGWLPCSPPLICSPSPASSFFGLFRHWRLLVGCRAMNRWASARLRRRG